MKKVLSNLEVYAGAVMMLIMVIILFCNVIGRYVLRHSIPWAEELCLILFTLSVYFGAAGAVKTRQHLRLETVLGKLGPKARMIMEIVDNCIFMVFNVIIMFGLVPLVQQLYKYKTSTAVLGIPKYINYIWLPIMFTLMSVRLIIDSVNRYKEWKADPTGEIAQAREQAELEAMLVEENEKEVD